MRAKAWNARVRSATGHTNHVRSPAEVDALLTHVPKFGATVVKPDTARTGEAIPVTSPADGFLWEVAHNPNFPHV